MITFACPACRSVHKVPDDQAGFKVPCAGCGRRVLVPTPPAPDATVAGVMVGVPPPVPPMPPPAPPVPAKPRKVMWYYEYQGRAVGPVSQEDLALLAEKGKLRPDARVWSDGRPGWQPAEAVLPRAFAGVDPPDGGGIGLMGVLAVILATCAFASAGICGYFYWSAGKATRALAAAKAGREPPPQEQGGSPPAPVPPPGPSGPAPLTPAQIAERCEKSVAIIKTRNGHGSGFVAAPNLVVTNAHVVAAGLAGDVKVLFPSGPDPKRELPATLVYDDPRRDLAVVRVDTPLPTLPLAGADPRKGEEVTVIGSPGNGAGGWSPNRVTGGRLSNTVAESDGLKFYEVDASINPGNSGGPVFNGQAQVVGVAVLKINNKELMNYIIPFGEVAGAVKRAADPAAAEAAAVARLAARHDARIVGAHLLAAAAVYDTLLERYRGVLRRSATDSTGVLGVHRDWRERTDKVAVRLLSAWVFEGGRGLTGGKREIPPGLRAALLDLIDAADNCQRLARGFPAVPTTLQTQLKDADDRLERAIAAFARELELDRKVLEDEFGHLAFDNGILELVGKN